MNPWFAKAVVLAGCLAMVAIRAPHGQRSTKVPVAFRRRGRLEAALLTLAWAGFFVPIVWVATPWLAFADYALHPAPFVAGTLKGVYRRVRHPMYLALLAYSVGQAILLPNWVAGPSYLVVIGILVALRVGPEERMMRERFGDAYDAYAARTRRFGP